MRRSKVVIAGLLAGSMILSHPAAVLAQELPADSEEMFLEAMDEESSEETLSESEAEEEMQESFEEVLESEDATSPEDEDFSDPGPLSDAQLEYKKSLIKNVGAIDFSALTEGVDYVKGEVIAPAYTLEEAEAIAMAYGATIKSLEYGVVVLDLQDTDYNVVTAYSAGIDDTRTNMPAVEPNYIIAAPEPVTGDEDAEFSSYGWERSYYDYGYNDPGLNPDNGEIYQWQHDMIHSYAAWGITTGNPEITVAVIDTGVQASHEDLSGKVKLAEGLTMPLAHDDDRNGHGTHVAGIIAAKIGNGVGGAGVAPDVTILAINASLDNEHNNFSTVNIVRAVNYVGGYSDNVVEDEDGNLTDYSTDSGVRRADIANMSLGGPGASQITEDALKHATKNGVTFAIAMGNEFSEERSFPAGSDIEGLIAVAAVNPAGIKAYFSNYGYWCDIAAPGTDIYSTVRDKKNPTSTKEYDCYSGTSMATPVVAGACALYMSAFGYTEPKKMEEIVKATASKSSSKGIGAGIIDLLKGRGEAFS